MLDERDVLSIYTRHKNALYRLCYCYMGNVQDASDAMQNTIVKLLEREQAFESVEHERGWLMKVAANECRRLLKHWWRKREDLDEYPEYAVQEERYEENGILSMVMSLSVKYRVPIYMYYYEGYAVAEISQLLHVKESTILSQLRRGRQKLKVELEADGDLSGFAHRQKGVEGK
ncbi:MAG: RNA polymerase sigma factor [Lachnospiraceae bacterium]|nr:RNA polymerase sigma factor [Lachnospiraceae bacterium]